VGAWGVSALGILAPAHVAETIATSTHHFVAAMGLLHTTSAPCAPSYFVLFHQFLEGALLIQQLLDGRLAALLLAARADSDGTLQPYWTKMIKMIAASRLASSQTVICCNQIVNRSGNCHLDCVLGTK